MTTLIVGARGMLGRAFCELLSQRHEPYIAVDRAEVDIADRASVTALLAQLPSEVTVILNCAAYTQVDDAERDEATATRVNGQGAQVLAELARERGSLLVHYSTDYVFAGDAQAPYRVDEPLAPLNAYGRSKAAGEEAIRAVAAPHLILRTSWLYAPWGPNFVRTIAKLSRERTELKVVNDQRGRPTSAEQLARTTLALLEAGARGTLHATDGGACTWFDFATEIVHLVKASCRVLPCASAEFPRPAKRPAYSVLDLGPTEALVGALPDWRESLADVVRRLEP